MLPIVRAELRRRAALIAVLAACVAAAASSTADEEDVPGDLESWHLEAASGGPAMMLGSAQRAGSHEISVLLNEAATTGSSYFFGDVLLEAAACLAGDTSGNPARVRALLIPADGGPGHAAERTVPACPDQVFFALDVRPFESCTSGSSCVLSFTAAFERVDGAVLGTASIGWSVNASVHGASPGGLPEGAALTVAVEP